MDQLSAAKQYPNKETSKPDDEASTSDTGSTDSRFKRTGVSRSSTGLFGRALASVRGHQQSKHVRKEGTIHVNSEFIKEITSIVCKGLPARLNDRESVRGLFDKYGIIARVFCNVKKEQAVIYFRTHRQAKAAKENGVRDLGIPNMSIFYHQPAYRTKKKSVSEDEVAEELKAMAGTKSLVDQQFLARKKAVYQNKRTSSVKPKRTSPVKPVAASNQTKSHKSDPSLLKFMAMSGQTCGDRYEILSSRDNLIRLQIKSRKQGKVTSAKTFSGTCRDMCPEKERYARQHKKQLSIFEILASSPPGENLVDHRLAIKEYSRSSADQEEPLPHDLRPVSTLTMTMDYLICNLMDVLETQSSISAGDWFDFVWNRTRAIRKDITQQHLCDSETVSLIEKCARFHIHCAERLCEEDMMNFDTRINNENLTKCMQTLKHLYYDLAVKGIECPHEDEFRAYDILLNLNTGEILSDVQKLKPEVRKSHHVLFALDVLTAINSNNYTRFFRLLRQGSYLHSCLMFRYFIQVRTRALHTILKAYCPVNRVVQFSLSDITKLLGFEDERDCASFCTNHGLLCDGFTLNFNRNMFYYPEDPPEITRAKKSIESKLTTSIGEVVNGGPLPANPMYYHVPHDSFKSDGYIKESAHDASDQVAKSTTRVESTAIEWTEVEHVVEPVAQSVRRDRAETIDDELVLSLATVVMLEVADEMIYETSDVFAQHMKKFQEMGERAGCVFRQLVSEVIGELCADEYKRMSDERTKMAESKRRLRIQKVINEIANELADGIIGNETTKLASDEVGELRRLESTRRAIDEITSCTIKEVVDDRTSKVASTVYRQRVTIVRKKIIKLRLKIRRRILKKYFQTWRRNHILSSRLKRNAEMFPSGPVQTSIETQLKELGGRAKLFPVQQIVDERLEIDHLCDVALLGGFLQEKIRRVPLNLASLLHQSVAASFQQTLHGDTCFYKLTISLPSEEHGSEITEWIKMKFGRDASSVQDPVSKIETLSSYTSEIRQPNGTKFDKMAICVKSVCGAINEVDDVNFALYGTLGIVSVITFDSLDAKETLEEAESRLLSVFRCIPAIPSVPLAILLCGECVLEDDDIIKTLDLNRMTSDHRLYRLTTDQSDTLSTKTLMDVVVWLGRRCGSVPEIFSTTIADFIERYAVRDVLRLICEDQQLRMKHGLVQQDPNVTVDFLNRSLSRMMDSDNNGSGMNISWPPGEFCRCHSELTPVDWSCESSAFTLRSYLEEIFLECFPSVCTWNDACDAIWDYVDLHRKPQLDNTEVVTRVLYLLERTVCQFRKSCLHEYGIEDCSPGVDNVPWTDIILTVVDYLLKYVRYTAVDESEKVYYVEERIKRMSCIPSPYSSVSCHRDCVSLETTMVSSAKRKWSEVSREENPKDEPKFERTELESKALRLSQELLDELKVERSNAENLEKRMRMCLADIEVRDEIPDENDEDERIEIGRRLLTESDRVETEMIKIRRLIDYNVKKSLEYDKKLGNLSS